MSFKLTENQLIKISCQDKLQIGQMPMEANLLFIFWKFSSTIYFSDLKYIQFNQPPAVKSVKHTKTRRFSYDVIFDVERERQEFNLRQERATMLKFDEPSNIRTI